MNIKNCEVCEWNHDGVEVMNATDDPYYECPLTGIIVYILRGGEKE